MPEHRSKDPLHGVTLEMVVTRLFERYGWEELARRVRVKCFSNDPSVKSSLVFFRRTPWARKELEDLYLAAILHPVPQERDGQEGKIPPTG
jgi:uncharacterized protein (DUF2132 family)